MHTVTRVTHCIEEIFVAHDTAKYSLVVTKQYKSLIRVSKGSAFLVF